MLAVIGHVWQAAALIALVYYTLRIVFSSRANREDSPE